MKKTNKIFSFVTTALLSITMAFATLTVGTAKADNVVVNADVLESKFKTVSNNTVTAYTYMPSYIIDRGYWHGPSNGVKITFKGVGENNAVEFNQEFSLSDVGSVLTFSALPSDVAFKNSVAEFKDLHVVLYEVDDDGKATGKQVTYIYNSAHKNVNGMKSLEVSKGEASSYFSAFAQNSASEAQKPYALVNDNKTYSNSLLPSVQGTPRYNSAGAGGSTSLHASMQDTRVPFQFGYEQTGSDNSLICKGTASGFCTKTGKEVVNGVEIDHDSCSTGYVRYGHTIRVFNEVRDPSTYYSDEQMDKSGYVYDETIFSGFDQNSKLKVKFYITDFYSSSAASFLIYKVGNVDLRSRVDAKINYNGIEDIAFPIPSAVYYNELGNVEASDYNVTITTKTGDPITSGVNLASYTFADAGEYKIKYSVTKAGYTYELTLIANILKANEVAPISLRNISYPTEFNNLYGSDYYVYAEAVTSIYTDNTKANIKAKLYRKEPHGDLLVKNLVIGENLNIKLLGEGLGEYYVRYEASDVLNRTAIYDAPLNQTYANRVTVNMVNGVDGKLENYYYGTGLDVTISKSDVTIYDGELGRDFILPTVTIYDTENNPYVLVDDIKFSEYLKKFANNKCGSYLVTYEYYYDYGAGNEINKTLTKRLNVVDAIAPTIYSTTDRKIFGAKINEEKTTSDASVFFTAKTGTTLQFDPIVAIDKVGETYSLTDKITISVVKPDGSLDSSVSTASAIDFNYLVNAPGRYVFRFEVNDEIEGVANRTSALVYVVEVANDFYKATVNGIYDIDNNVDKFTLSQVTVTNYDGNVVNANVTVTAVGSDGEVEWTGVPGDVKQFLVADTYDIIVTAKIGNEIVDEKVYSVLIKDNTKPQIIVKGNIIAKSVVGKEIVLGEVTTEDENGFANVVVDVILGQNNINVYQNAFTPIEAGTYKVTYTATDMAGNVNVYEYEILVVEDFEGSIASLFNGYGIFFAIPLIVVAGALAYLFFIKKKKSNA